MIIIFWMNTLQQKLLVLRKTSVLVRRLEMKPLVRQF